MGVRRVGASSLMGQTKQNGVLKKDRYRDTNIKMYSINESKVVIQCMSMK